MQKALADGADVNIKLRNGGTILHWAARFCQPQIYKLLLEHGADAKAKDRGGSTPAHGSGKRPHGNQRAAAAVRD